MNGADLLTGVVAGVVAAILWAVIVEVRHRLKLWRNFAHLAGTYSSTRKKGSQPEAETITITVRGRVLHVTYDGLSDGGPARGEIVMNEHLPRSGEGYYSHMHRGHTLWGFYRVEVTDDGSILVHTDWLNADTGLAEMSAYIWKRIAATG